jgi:hypothetical protein
LVAVIAIIMAGVVTASMTPPNPRASIAPSRPSSTAPASAPSVPPTLDAISSPVATSGPVANSPVPGHDAAAILAGTTPRLSRDHLVAGVRDGSLEGRLVFVDGVMHSTPAGCIDPAREPLDCVELEIPGLGLPVMPGDSATPWPGDPPPGAWLVTVARGDGLVYLGSLVPWPDGPRGLTGLRMPLSRRGGVPPHGSLFEVDGFLVADPGSSCGIVGPDATQCPAPPPFLAEDQPLADGIRVSDAGEEVVLTGSVPGVDPSAVVTPGPFLVVPVGPGGDPWRIVARYEPAHSVRVLVP